MIHASPLGSDTDTRLLLRWYRNLTDDGPDSAHATKSPGLSYVGFGVGGGLEGFGPGAYVTVNYSTPLDDRGLFDVWLKADDVSQGNILADWDVSDTDKQTFRLYLDGGYLRFEMRSATAGTLKTLTSNHPVHAGRVTHVRGEFTWASAVADSDWLSLLVDGNLDASTVFTGGTGGVRLTNRPTVLGSVFDGGAISTAASECFSGTIGEVRLNASVEGSVSDMAAAEDGSPFGAWYRPVTRRKYGLLEMSVREHYKTDWAGHWAYWLDVSDSGTNFNPLHSDVSVRRQAAAGSVYDELTRVGLHHYSAVPTDSYCINGGLWTNPVATDVEAMVLEFKKRYSNYPMVVGDAFVDGRVTQLPRIQRKVSWVGERMTTGIAGEIRLSNWDEWFDPIINEEVDFQAEGSDIVLFNSEYSMLVGGDHVPFGEWPVVAKARIGTGTSNDSEVSLPGFETKVGVLEAKVPPSIVGVNGWLACPTESIGKTLPIVSGSGHIQVEGVVVGKTGHKVCFNARECGSISNVRLNDTISVPTSAYTDNVTSGLITITNLTYYEDAGVYTADVDGIANTDFPAETAKHWLAEFGRVPLADFHADFLADDATETVELRYHIPINAGRTIEQILRVIRDTRFFWIFQGYDGLWRCRSIRSDDSDAVDISLFDEDFISFGLRSIDELLCSSAEAIALSYPDSPQFRTETAVRESMVVNTKYDRQAPLQYYANDTTMFKTKAAAEAWLAQMDKMGHTKPPVVIEASTTLGMLQENLLARVSLTRRRGPDSVGQGSGNWRLTEWALDPNTWIIDVTLVPEGIFPAEGE